MEYISRAIEHTFLKASANFKAVLLTGPRQSGKTTMLKKLAKEENRNRKYVSLDNFNARKMAVDDPEGFLQLYSPPVLIDEVQYAPQLFSYIKAYVDEHLENGDFWLTGSQIFKLMDGVQESMAGRVAVLSMSTLSQNEIKGYSSAQFKIDFKELIQRCENRQAVSLPALYDLIYQGSLPDVMGADEEKRDQVYASYISTYIERDVKEISGTIEALKFFNFVTATAAHMGQILNYKTIADATGISLPTAKEWMNIMERLGIIFFLHPYSNNLLKRTISKPKLYFYDTGLAVYLSRWSSGQTLMNGAASGAALENFVVSEIVKSYQNAGKRHNLYYYRDKDAKEIDLLYEADGTLFPMEIKRTGTPDSRLINVFSVLEKSGLKLGQGAILCTSSSLASINSDNYIVPIWGI